MYDVTTALQWYVHVQCYDEAILGRVYVHSDGESLWTVQIHFEGACILSMMLNWRVYVFETSGAIRSKKNLPGLL